MAKDPVESALEELQKLVHRESEAENPPHPASHVNLDPAPGSEETVLLVLSSAARAAGRQAAAAIVADPRFEHLGNDAQGKVWEFVYLVDSAPAGNHVAEFIASYAQEPTERTCYFPVESLSVSERLELQGASLLPTEPKEAVPDEAAPIARDGIGAIAVVTVSGTDPQAMHDRARARGDYALRLLRIAIGEDRDVTPEQLRFKLGDSFTYGGLPGWRIPPGASISVELDRGLYDRAREQPIWDLPPQPPTKLLRRAARASDWIEQAFFAATPLLELLFYFFALEALVGERSDGLKSHSIAFRRALLGMAATGTFSHPSPTALLYDKVRSLAVHGGEPFEFEPGLLTRFGWDTRRALAEFLSYVEETEITKWKRLLDALEAQPQREKLIEWLRENEPQEWNEYLDTLK